MKKYIGANLEYVPDGYYKLTVITDDSGNKQLFVEPCKPAEAEWLDVGPHSVCSNCNFYATDEYELGKGRYCPECGSKMKNPFHNEDWNTMKL